MAQKPKKQSQSDRRMIAACDAITESPKTVWVNWKVVKRQLKLKK